MLKFGHIDKIDAGTGRARVRFENNELQSDWLPMVVRKTKADKDFFMFDEGDHVACMMDERCNNGVILGAIYDETNKPEGRTKDVVGVTFSDGSKVEFDRATGNYTLDMKGAVRIKGAPKVTVDCDLQVNGTVKAQGIESSGSVKASGKVEADGNIESKADVRAGTVTPTTTVKLLTHVHPTAAPGPASPPTPGT